MGVGSIESNRQDIQNLKEAYEEREKGTVEKNKRHLADEESRHEHQINDLRDRFDKTLSKDNAKSREVVSEKQIQHTKDVQELQNASRQKIAKMSEDNYDKTESQERNYNKEIENTKEGAKKTEERLYDTFDNEISKRDKESSDMEKDYREGSQESIKHQAQRLQDHFREEKEHLTKNFKQSLESKDLELNSARKENFIETTDLKTAKENQKHGLEKRYGTLLQNQNRAFSQNATNMEEGLGQALKDSREKYKDLSEKNTDQFHNNFEKLKETTSSRVDIDVKNQKLANENQSSENSFDKAKIQQDARIQRANLNNDFKRNFEELEARRMAAVHDGNRVKKEEIESLQLKQNRAYQKMNQEYISKFNDFKGKVDGEYYGQIEETQREKTVSQLQGDNSRKKLAQNYAESIVSQNEFHEDQIESTKRDSKKMVDGVRVSQEKSRSMQVNTLRDKMLKQSIDNQQKLSDITEKYESLIGSMKGDYEKKFRRQGETFSAETEKQMKFVGMDRDQQEAKFQARLGQMKESFDKEIEQVRKRQNVERNDAALNKKT